METKKISVDTFPIRLGQFLKFSNVVQDGLEAKLLIINGEIKVNGRVEVQRGKKLVSGDEVQINDVLLTLA